MEWPHLQVGDDAVLNVLLLLTQEVEAHSVERVGAELVFPKQHLGRLRWSGASEVWGRVSPVQGAASRAVVSGLEGLWYLGGWVMVEPEVGGASI